MAHTTSYHAHSQTSQWLTWFPSEKSVRATHKYLHANAKLMTEQLQLETFTYDARALVTQLWSEKEKTIEAEMVLLE